MSITIEQSRLVDEARKQKHSEETGYDYSKQVQREIQNFVEAEIEFESERTISLIPKAGITNNIKISQEDIDAYVASHPQNAARRGERASIADVLSAGGSTLDEEGPTQQQVDEESLPNKVYLSFPPLPVEEEGYSTHFSVAVTSGYTRPVESNDYVYRIIEASENLVVIDDYVGPGGKFAYVKSKLNPEYKPFYIKNDSIALINESVKQTPFDILADGAIPNGGEIPEWTSLPTNKPIEFPQLGAYVISVTLDDEVIDGQETDDGRFIIESDNTSEESYKYYLEEGFYKGVAKILDFNEKESSEGYITDNLVHTDYWDRPARATEVYFEPRVGTKIKVFVQVPIRTIATLKDKDEPNWEYVAEYDIATFKDKIEKVKEKIESIKSEIDGYKGKVLQFSSDKEAEKVANIPKDIEFLANKNDVDIFSSTGKFKIYWDFNMKPVMFHYSPESGEETRLKKNFGEFTEKLSSKSRRTQWILLSIDNITEELDIPWEDFLYDWIRFKEVQIIPDPEEQVSSGEAEGPLVKTKEELLKEERYINNLQRKIERKEKREKETNPVGSPNMNQEEFQKKKGMLDEGVDTLYEKFINNIDFRKITMQSLSCVLNDLPVDAFTRIQNDYRVLKKESDKLKKQKKEGKVFDFLYPDELPTDDISEAFFKTLGSTLGTMVSTTISTILNNAFSTFFNACGERAEVVPPFPEPLDIGDSLRELNALTNDLFGEGNIDGNTITSILDDLANLLSPKEFCDLLKGRPDQNTLDIVGNLLDASYCKLGLDTEEEIINFFLTIAQGIDLSICDEIEDFARTLPDDFLCPPNSSVRDRLLRDRGMSPEQIQEQLDRERERSRKLAEQFLDDLNKDGSIPNLFCSKDEQGNIIPGEIPFMDDQFAYTLETTLTSLFKNTYDSFTLEGEKYIQNLFVEVQEKEQLPAYADGEDFIVPEFLITKRKIVPQLVKFYKNPKLEESPNIKQFSIEIPGALSSEIENISALASRTSPFLEEVFGNISPNQNASNTLEKIVFTESIASLPNPLPQQPQVIQETEERVELGQTEVKDNGCREDVRPPLKTYLGSLENEKITIIDSDNNQVIDDIANVGGLFLDESLEEKRGSLNYTINVNGKYYNENEDIPQNIINFFNENMSIEDSIDSVSLLESVFRYSINQEQLDQSTKINNKKIVSENIEKIYENIRKRLMMYIFKTMSNSRYLESNTTQQDDVKVERFIMEYVNLGPVPIPECDPHLLKIKELIDEIKNNLQGEMCLDLNSISSSDDRQLSPLEKNMMKACLTLIIRHYILETYAKAILTTSSLEGRSLKMNNIKAKYIFDKMRESMLEYSSNREGTSGDCNKPTIFTGEMPSYYEDFISQVRETFGERSINEIIKREFRKVSQGFKDIILMPSNKNSIREEIEELANVQEVLQVDSAPGIDTTRINAVSFSDSSLNGKINTLSGFVKYKDHFSILIDEYPIEEYKATFPDGQVKYIIPIIKLEEDVKSESSPTPTILSAIFDFCFPVEKYTTLLSIHESETLSKMNNIENAFGETRDNLFSLFYAILPEKDDWRKQNKSLASVGDTSTYTKIFDFNNNVFDTPCTDFSFNLGNVDVCWGNSFKGLGMSTALRLARDAALLEFKKYVEMNDPAVKLAKRLSFLSKLACVNIPTSLIAGTLNTANPLLFPPTPIANVYHALGLGVFLPSSMLNSDSDEGAIARKEITDAGLALPPYCGPAIDDSNRQLQSQNNSDNGFLPGGPAVQDIGNVVFAEPTAEDRQRERQRILDEIEDLEQRLEEVELNIAKKTQEIFEKAGTPFQSLVQNEKDRLEEERDAILFEIATLEQQL